MRTCRQFSKEEMRMANKPEKRKGLNSGETQCKILVTLNICERARSKLYR